jgi:tight adherence protein B
LLLTLLTFLAVLLACLGAYSIFADLFLRDRSRVSRRVDDELRKQQRERARQSLLFKDLGPAAPSFQQGPDAEPTGWAALPLTLEQSGLNIAPRRLFTLMGAAALLAAAVAALILRGPLAALLAALLAGPIPLLYVLAKRKARLGKMLAQLPDAFELMARVLRAGQTTSQSLQAVGDEFAPPLAAEFAYCFEQQNLGLSPELAMRDLARRTGLLEMKIFVLGLLVQQQTGGNLADLLDKLSGMVRSRDRVRGKISALTAESRMQAVVLLALPPALFGLFFLISPAYPLALLKYPWILVGVAASELLGALCLRSIVNFDF